MRRAALLLLVFGLAGCRPDFLERCVLAHIEGQAMVVTNIRGDEQQRDYARREMAGAVVVQCLHLRRQLYEATKEP